MSRRNSTRRSQRGIDTTTRNNDDLRVKQADALATWRAGHHQGTIELLERRKLAKHEADARVARVALDDEIVANRVEACGGAIASYHSRLIDVRNARLAVLVRSTEHIDEFRLQSAAVARSRRGPRSTAAPASYQQSTFIDSSLQRNGGSEADGTFGGNIAGVGNGDSFTAPSTPSPQRRSQGHVGIIAARVAFIIVNDVCASDIGACRGSFTFTPSHAHIENVLNCRVVCLRQSVFVVAVLTNVSAMPMHADR